MPVFKSVWLCRINNCDAILIYLVFQHTLSIIIIINSRQYIVGLLDRAAVDIIALELLEVLGHRDMFKCGFNVLGQYLLSAALRLIELVPGSLHLFSDIV